MIAVTMATDEHTHTRFLLNMINFPIRRTIFYFYRILKPEKMSIKELFALSEPSFND